MKILLSISNNTTKFQKKPLFRVFSKILLNKITILFQFFKKILLKKYIIIKFLSLN
jgi:hypothetical protein